MVSAPVRRRMVRVGLILVFLGFCVTPYLGWGRYPSLFDDDFARVGDFRRSDLSSSLFRPFNEHLAPLFEFVSWLAWWGAARRVEGIADGFLVASYLAAAATVTCLAALVRLELRSTLAAMIAVSSFCLSTVSAETVLWYSAGSFQWAAATSLAAWFAATVATRSASPRSQTGWLIASGLFALASPLFSAIGALAGPLASLRLISANRPERIKLKSRRTSIVAAIIPSLGTLAYVVLVVANKTHGAAVSASVRRHLDIQATLWATVRVPSLVLIPKMVGLPSLSGWCPDRWAACSTMVLAFGVVAWAWRSRFHRGLIAVGLGWVIGGYLLAYSARAEVGDRWILEVGRYHLFPELGVICLASAILGPWLDRLESRRRWAGLTGVILVAGVGFALQSPAMSELTRRSFRYPNQGRAIAAALRLEAVCDAEQVPFAQATRIIDPTEPRWFPRPSPFHPLLYLFKVDQRPARRTDAEARLSVLQRLSPDDREAIFGGLNAARYLSVDRSREGEEAWFPLDPIGQGAEARIGEGKLFFEEFAVPERRDAVTLRLAGVTGGTKLEVWWSSGAGSWDSGRSFRITVGPEGANIALSKMPHWRPGFARRFRAIRRGGPLPASDHLVITCQAHSD